MSPSQATLFVLNTVLHPFFSVQFTSLQKEIDDYKAEIQRQQNENNKLQGVIKSLEKDIYGLKKEIQERDETIQDKVG